MYVTFITQVNENYYSFIRVCIPHNLPFMTVKKLIHDYALNLQDDKPVQFCTSLLQQRARYDETSFVIHKTPVVCFVSNPTRSGFTT